VIDKDITFHLLTTSLSKSLFEDILDQAR